MPLYSSCPPVAVCGGFEFATHWSVLLLFPDAGGGGVAAFTEIVIVRVTDPAEFVAVSVYVVVADGVTVADADAPTAPTPLSIVTDVAPVVVHDSVVDAPAVMLPADAVNNPIVGCAAVTVTVAVRVTIPTEFVAV